MHMIVVPQSEEGLRRAIGGGEARRRYSRRVYFLKDGGGIYGKDDSPPLYWMSGAFWQRHATWSSSPVRTGMVKDPGAYPCSSTAGSSAAAHISGRGNDLVKVKPLGRELEEVSSGWRIRGRNREDRTS